MSHTNEVHPHDAPTFGDYLKNGAFVLAHRGYCVLAFTENGAVQPWVIWQYNPLNGDTYDGHYYNTELDAMRAWVRLHG